MAVWVSTIYPVRVASPQQPIWLSGSPPFTLSGWHRYSNQYGCLGLHHLPCPGGIATATNMAVWVSTIYPVRVASPQQPIWLSGSPPFTLSGWHRHNNQYGCLGLHHLPCPGGIATTTNMAVRVSTIYPVRVASLQQPIWLSGSPPFTLSGWHRHNNQYGCLGLHHLPCPGGIATTTNMAVWVSTIYPVRVASPQQPIWLSGSPPFTLSGWHRHNNQYGCLGLHHLPCPGGIATTTNMTVWVSTIASGHIHTPPHLNIY